MRIIYGNKRASILSQQRSPTLSKKLIAIYNSSLQIAIKIMFRLKCTN